MELNYLNDAQIKWSLIKTKSLYRHQLKQTVMILTLQSS